MNKLAIAVSCAALCGGCAMKEFSSMPLYSGDEVVFTGAVEDRVNLWPLAYWREPVGSVAWPVFSWGADHLAVRPVFSVYKQYRSEGYDEFNFLWPVCQADTKHGDYRIFPFFWGDSSCEGETYFCLFPALWRNSEFAGAFPFFWPRGGGGGGFCVFPLFWAETLSSGSLWNTLWPLYYYESKPVEDAGADTRHSEFWALCYLAGYERRGGGFLNHRLLPFYLWDGGDFWSLPYSRYRIKGVVHNRLLLGLAGMDADGETGAYAASWLFPLYYHDAKRLVTPLFGKADDALWFFPLFYRDEDSFVTPLYGRMGDADWLFPVFYRDEDSFVSPIYGRICDTDWFFPLYFRDEQSFLSIPFGWTGSGASTNCYAAAGLAGVRCGGTRGWWLFPFYDKETDADFEEKLAWLDADSLPDEINVWTEIRTNSVWNSEKKVFEEVASPKIVADCFWRSDTRTHLLLFDNDRTFSAYDSFNTYEMRARHKTGNLLVFNHEKVRKAKFDLATRKKISDTETSDTSLLMFLYQGEREIDRMKGEYYVCHNVLWKLWDWEEENGDVALDVFPGFTYDSRKDGYVKTSLLWRLFRYENDPGKGVAIDFLFIPLWR